MDISINSYIDVMKALGIGSQKRFEAWYEKYLKGRENMNFNIDGFTWDDAQIGFDYKFVEVTDTVTAMATYLDPYSQAVARGREIPMRTIEGYIPPSETLRYPRRERLPHSRDSGTGTFRCCDTQRRIAIRRHSAVFLKESP